MDSNVRAGSIPASSTERETAVSLFFCFVVVGVGTYVSMRGLATSVAALRFRLRVPKKGCTTWLYTLFI